MHWAAYLLLAFLSGSVPFSWLLGKLKGVDLREHGSGNPGATNLLRTCGTAMGVAGLLLDAVKGAAPVLVAISSAAPQPWLPGAAVLSAILGHVFMPWFGFRGGKGVATALGALLVLAPIPVLCGLGVFLVLVALFRMISLGSVLGGISLPLWGLLFSQPRYSMTVLAAVALAIVATHRKNIGRILSGTERKLGGKE